MSIWVNVFCRRSIESLRPEDLLRGIQKRLTVMTYLLVPDEEEEPDDVSQRLEVETSRPGAAFQRFAIHYRPEHERSLGAERWNDPVTVREEVAEFLEGLAARDEPAAERVREHLGATIETVGIELKASDARSMGWPVAICAAAEIAERGEGIIRAEDLGWLVPSGREVDFLLRGA